MFQKGCKFINKEGAVPGPITSSKPRFFIFSPLNTWTLEGIHFQRDFRKGSKLFEHTQLIL